MKRLSELSGMTGTFGRDKVAREDRKASVTALFDRVAPRYDLMNDLMSFGLHRLWKRTTVRIALRQLQGRTGPLVDLAGGTGDIALAIKAGDPTRRVLIADASSGMLEQARRRGGDKLEYLRADAEELPLADASAAAVTLAFGLRNMTEPDRALAEVARILAPGASLVLLEFSRPAAWFAPFYALHSRFVIPVLGALVAGDRRAYTYLVESIRLFPAADDITRAIEAAGLTVVETRPFMFGVAMLHVAEK
jgi:demethylmenaquinone methyltransferase/2-methoxy-6-polyprenyl-1,4-benzoquinol methylase